MRYLAAVGLGLGLALTPASAAADTVTETITVASPSAGITMNADGTRVYVADYDAGGLSVIDTTTGQVRDLPGVVVPHDVAVNADGTRAYVTASTADGALAVVDLVKGVPVRHIGVGTFPQAVEITPGGDQVWVANFGTGGQDSTVTVVTTKNNKVAADIVVGEHPTALAFAPDGTRAYVTHADLSGEETGTLAVVDTASHTITAVVELGAWLTSVALSPDGTQAYVTDASSGTLLVIDTTTCERTCTITAQVDVGAWPTDVVVTSDGTRAYVVSSGSGSVAVVDTATMTVIDTLDVEHPHAIAVAPDATVAWVTSRASDQVTVLDLTTPAQTSVLAAGQVDRPYQVRVGPTGTDAVITVTSGTLPEGLALDDATITGTPTTEGESAFTLTTTTGASTISVDYQIRVDPAPITEPTSTVAQRSVTGAFVWVAGLALVATTFLVVARQHV